MRKPKISLIIPAHNEERRIGRTLNRFFKIFSDQFRDDFEIIIIINNCNDRTLNVVQDFCRSSSNLRFKNFNSSIGKGGAIIEGFKLAKGEYVSFVDADGSTGPFDFLRVMRGIGGNDGAIGSRWLTDSKKINHPFSRKIISRGFNILVRVLFRFPYRDTQCGAKIFRKESIDCLLSDLGISGFSFDVELLYLLHKKGFKIIEIPIRWKHYGKSSLDMRKAIPLMFLSVVRLRIMESRLRYVLGPLMNMFMR